MKRNNIRSVLWIPSFLAIIIISIFVISTTAQFSQSGQVTAKLTAAIQTAISTGGDPNPYGTQGAYFALGNSLLPGASGITKQATITNNGNVNLKYRFTTSSLEDAYYKMSGQINMQLYVNNVLEYSGPFAGASTPFHNLATGDSVSVKAILSWPYSPIDNNFNDAVFSDRINFSAQLENGDTGFFMMDGGIYIDGRSMNWLVPVSYLSASQPITRNSASLALACPQYYSSTTLQYSTSPNFTNPKTLTVTKPANCIFSMPSNLTGLTPNTTYYVRNRGNNPPAPISNLPVDKMWSPTFTFKTLP